MHGKSWTGVTAIAAALLGALFLPSSRPALAGGRWGSDYFPNVPLMTQEGQTVRFYDDLLKGKRVVVDLIYTHCPDVCPLETARLVQVQKLLGDRVGKDLFFYSISIDPKHDTPAVLKAYAEKFHVGPGWLFLTGDRANITLVSKKLGLSSLTDADNPDGHQASLMVGDEPSGLWMRRSAVDNPRFLAMTIRSFLALGDPEGARKSYAEAAPLPMPAEGRPLFAGQHLFQTHCAACHTVGRGDKIGPDLLGVTGRRERGWLTRFIQRPDQLLEASDPLAMELFAKYKRIQMPNLRLGEGDVAAVLQYLDVQSAKLEGTDQQDALAQRPNGERASPQMQHHPEEEAMP